MRPEHHYTADENDMRYWRKVLVGFSRAGVSKSIKKNSHRLDRQVKQRRIREGEAEYLEGLELDRATEGDGCS